MTNRPMELASVFLLVCLLHSVGCGDSSDKGADANSTPNAGSGGSTATNGGGGRPGSGGSSGSGGAISENCYAKVVMNDSNVDLGKFPLNRCTILWEPEIPRLSCSIEGKGGIKMYAMVIREDVPIGVGEEKEVPVTQLGMGDAEVRLLASVDRTSGKSGTGTWDADDQVVKFKRLGEKEFSAEMESVKFTRPERGDNNPGTGNVTIDAVIRGTSR